MILDGNVISISKMDYIKKEIDSIKNTHGIEPELKLIQVGNDSASTIYANAKIKRGKKLGINVTLDKYDAIDERGLASIIKKHSENVNIHGIMIESPLPYNIDYNKIIRNVPYYKDTDGLNPYNLGNLDLRNESIAPATARAVIDILEYYGFMDGNVCIINRSAVVGRPLSMMLLNRNYTVTLCHSKTPNIQEISVRSNVIVVAVGKKNFLNEKYITDKSIVVDVGINYENNHIYGDADFDGINKIVKAITPVPGGVGPVTATDIFHNFLNGLKIQLEPEFR